MSAHAYQEVSRCRICGSPQLNPILDLGAQALTGVFPRDRHQPITCGPLELVQCRADCGLVQLRHSFSPDEMYRGNYGYRSGLNESMIRHLHDIVRDAQTFVTLAPGDVVLDIGSNDATLLKAYTVPGLNRIGIDPSAGNFREFYPPDIALVTDYFTAAAYRGVMGNRSAKIVTSIAMFYDLPAPLEFMREVKSILAPDGIWAFEQSYLPTMIEQNAYDTVCHEHVEYYGLRQIKWMTDRVGLKILAVELNDINGGSFRVTVAHDNSPHRATTDCHALLAREDAAGYTTRQPYDQFRDRVARHRDELRAAVSQLHRDGRRLLGYGASTKGNVILQFCGFTANDIPAIADRNPAKFGCYTPGTLIPIVSEADARARKPDCFLALPWHFRTGFLDREREFLTRGGQFLFPLPRIEFVGA